MPRSVSELRTDPFAEVAYVLFIEGVDVAFTTEENDEIWGTKYIGTDFGIRNIVPGLVLPTVGEGLDFDTGQPDDRIRTFTIADVDGILPALFKRSHETEEILFRTVPAGRGLLTTAWTNKGQVVSIRNKHLGTEAIGPDGERRYLECFPFNISTPGDEHPVDFEDPLRLPRVGVTDTPAVFQGRRVSIYRIYKDPRDAPGAAAWPSWRLQHEAEGLAWQGTMRGKGTIQANRMWSIQCMGISSMLSRQLGIRSQTGWVPIVGTINLEADKEDLIAVEPTHTSVAGVVTQSDADAFNTSHRVVGTSPIAITASVAGIVGDVIDGSVANRPQGPLAWDSFDHRITIKVGELSIGTKPLGITTALQANMVIVAHIKVWRAMGFEPRTQDRLYEDDPDDEQGVLFQRVDQTFRVGEPGDPVPGPDYWQGRFATNRRIRGNPVAGAIDNYGADMIYKGISSVGIITLSSRGSSSGSATTSVPIDIANGTATPRIEGQTTIPFSDATISSLSVDSARFFEFRGKTVRAREGELKSEEFRTVARLSWVNVSGHPADGPGGLPRLNVDEFVDPRPFGINELPLTSGIRFETGQMEIRPLTAWAYMEDISQPNRPGKAHEVLSQILLSSGTAAGYSAADNDNPILLPGQNQKGFAAGDSEFGDDLEIADMGLTFPRELVADAPAFRDAFDAVPGGYEGGFNRVRYAYGGSIGSSDIFKSIMEPRRLAWGMHGNILTPIFIGPVDRDVDFVITEDDMAVREGPETEQNATQPISATSLNYRYNPSSGETKETEFAPAKDRGAYTRTEGKVRKLIDHGLMPPQWWTENGESFTAKLGIEDWRADYRRMWGVDAAEFYSAAHFLVTLKINRIKGQDIRIGSTVKLTNPWPVSPSGVYGLALEPGLVVSAEYSARDEMCTAEVLVFALPKVLYFSPRIEVLGFIGADVHLAEDPGAFIEPEGSALGGNADIQIEGFDRADWEILHTARVLSRTAGQNVLTLDSAPTSAFRDKFKYISMGQPQSAAWVNAIYAKTSRPDGTRGSTDADRFGDA